MKFVFAAGLVLSALLISSGRAQAASSTGYPCLLENVYNSTWLGNEGSWYVYLYSQPDCGGTFVANYTAFSEGGSPAYGVDGFRYKPTAFWALYRTVVDAINNDKRVLIMSCNDANPTCLGRLRVLAN
jgi:hypothetical protein